MSLGITELISILVIVLVLVYSSTPLLLVWFELCGTMLSWCLFFTSASMRFNYICTHQLNNSDGTHSL